MNKKIFCERIHFKKRLYERYGLMCNRFDIKEIVTKIQKQHGFFINRISDRISNWCIYYKNTWIFVGYDTLRHTVITALPHEDKDREYFEQDYNE